MMVWVNFLPWRQRQRLRQRLRILLLPGFLALLPLAVFLQAAGQQAANTQRQNSVAYWQKANQQLNALKARAAVLTAQRRRLLQEVTARERQQQKILNWCVFVRGLATQMPETLWLSEMNQTAAGLRLTGFSEGMREMRNFRQRLRNVALFRQVKTENISLDERGGIRFSLLGAFWSEGGSDE